MKLSGDGIQVRPRISEALVAGRVATLCGENDFITIDGLV